MVHCDWSNRARFKADHWLWTRNPYNPTRPLTSIIATGDAAMLMPANDPPASRFKEFFNSWNMEIVFFQVENSLFAMPRHVLNYPGTPFETMFTLPQATSEADKRGTGVDANNAILLEQVAEDDFEAFLHALYPSENNAVAPPKLLADGYSYWLGVLKLATKWEFDKVRERAINRLTVLLDAKPPLESVHFGRTYSVTKWIRNGFIKLCAKESLTFKELRELEEGESPSSFALDWKTIATLFYIQKQVPTSNSNQPQLCTYCQSQWGYAKYLNNTGYCEYCGQTKAPQPPTTALVEKLVDEHFREELSTTTV